MKKTMKKFGKHALAFAISALTITSFYLLAGTVFAAVDPKKYLSESGVGAAIGGTGDDLPALIGRVVTLIMQLLGLILVIIIIWAGFIWMTSNGDPAKLKKAKDMIYQSIIGLLLVFASYAIGSFVIDKLQNIATGTGGN